MRLISIIFIFMMMISTVCSARSLVDRILAIVNDDIITQSDLDEFRQKIASSPMMLELLPGGKKALKKDRLLLNKMIEDRLVQQAVRELKMEATDQQIDSQIKMIQKQNRISRQQLIETLKMNNTTFLEYQDNIRRQIERANIIESQIKVKISVTDDDAKHYYYTYIDKNTTTQEYRFKNILFTGSNLKEAADEARNARNKIRSGRVSFESICSAYYRGTKYPDDCDMGYVQLPQLNKRLAQEIQKLKINEISPVFKTRNGYHIVKLTEKRYSTSEAFLKKKEEIIRKLRQKALERHFESWIQTRRNHAFIKVNL